MLRWTDVNDVGNDHGVAIDNLSVTPTAAVASAHPADSCPSHRCSLAGDLEPKHSSATFPPTVQCR